jgi:signal transduction histidine kinase/putative methionine-R-sulfoxide reductase with GAF domain
MTGIQGASRAGAQERLTERRPEHRVLESLVAAQEEELQAAHSVHDVIETVKRAVSSQPGTGAGTVFLLDERGELEEAAAIEGPEANRLVVPPYELRGIARRALRENQIVRQAGVGGGASLWGAPLQTSGRIEGVVAAVGECDVLTHFLEHAGIALARERRRQRERAGEGNVAGSQRDLAFELIDSFLAETEEEGALERLIAAVAGVPGVAAAALWVLDESEGVYVEHCHAAASGSAPSLPAQARRPESLERWFDGRPRWLGAHWLPQGSVQRTCPAAGDLLVWSLKGPAGTRPAGVLITVTGESLAPAAEASLGRWAAIARLAMVRRSGSAKAAAELAALREERERLAEYHRMKSQFIAAISHELRTPLTSISAYAETLRSPRARNNTETREHFLRVIYEESRRLTRIVDDILDLSTLDAGRVRLSCRSIDLWKVVGDALDVIRPLADKRGITVSAPAAERYDVHADPDLMKQLVVNLLENAVKFAREEGKVSVELSLDGTSVRLVVTDDGPGIPADMLERIFDQFVQVDGSNTRRHGGAGLGLSICRSIVTWHDGRIWAESEEGHGARFIVSLPRERARSQRRVKDLSLPAEHEASSRVPELLIEMISEVLCVEMVSLMLLEEDGEQLYVHAALGLPDEAIREARVKVGSRIAGLVAQTGESLLIPDLERDGRFSSSRPEQYRTRSVLSVPVLLGSKTIGVINVNNKTSGAPFNEYDRDLLEVLAERVAIVMSNLQEFGDSRDRIRQLETALRGVIDVRRHYYPSREDFTGYVLGVCAELRIDPETAAKIHYAGILRDVGMIRVPEGIYKKSAALTQAERAQIRRHPDEGAEVLEPIEHVEDVFDIVRSHHEKFNGTGYPRGLSGEEIPLGGKVLAVVDAYHALRTGRPYRDPVPVAAAVRELRSQAGAQFDAEVVEALISVLEARGEYREPEAEETSEDGSESRSEET